MRRWWSRRRGKRLRRIWQRTDARATRRWLVSMASPDLWDEVLWKQAERLNQRIIREITRR